MHLIFNIDRPCGSCPICACTRHVTAQLPCLPCTAAGGAGPSCITCLQLLSAKQLPCPSRGHADDVWDLSWSPDSTALVSASSDNECNLFSVAAMKSKFRLNQHKHLVQGVAWDPAREYILSASSDKTVRWVGNVSTVCLGMA